jgi:hypothetical protein
MVCPWTQDQRICAAWGSGWQTIFGPLDREGRRIKLRAEHQRFSAAVGGST